MNCSIAIARQNKTKKVLTFLLSFYFFISPFEMFIGPTFEVLFKYYQIFLLLPLIYFSISCRNRKAKSINGPVIYYILLLIYIIITLVYSSDQSQGFSYLLALGIRLLLIITALFNYFDPNSIRIICNGYILGSVILGIRVFFSEATASTINRVTLEYEGGVFDTNNLSGLLVLGLALLVQMEYKRKGLIKTFLIIFLTIVIIMTGSRGGCVAMIAIYIYWCISKHNFKSLIKYLIIISFVFFATYLIMQKLKMPYLDNIIDRFLYDRNGSGAERVTVWIKSLQAFIRKPIFGYGIGSSFYILNNFYNSSISTHNVFITFLLDYGVFGFSLFIIPIFKFIFKKYPSCDYISRAAKSMLIAALFIGLFLDIYNKKILWLPLLILAMNWNAGRESKNIEITGNKY